MKHCAGCNRTLPRSSFAKRSDRPSGIQSRCRECHIAYNREHREQLRKKERERVSANPAKYKRKRREKYLKHQNKELARCSLYRKSHLPYYASLRAKYRAAQTNATPHWLTQAHKKEIQFIYASCPKGHHVDHVIPLRGDTVCGLHVPWNLQHLPASENLSKSNRLVA